MMKAAAIHPTELEQQEIGVCGNYIVLHYGRLTMMEAIAIHYI